MSEARYALDVLAADGIVVHSNHAGLYLGDGRLDPFYSALDERHAVLFIHPTSPSCADCGSLSLGYPSPMLEFMFETTRTVTNMILSGVTVRYPNIRIIVPHAGAALPVLASRIALVSALFVNGSNHAAPDVRVELRKLYYDLAGVPLPELLEALLSVADPQHIFYGSDWPATPLDTCKMLAAELDAALGDSTPTRDAFMCDNAARMFPTPAPVALA